MLHYSIRNHNEEVSFFNEKITKNFSQGVTLNYEGVSAEYEDIADYIRTGPIKAVRLG